MVEREAYPPTLAKYRIIRRLLINEKLSFASMDTAINSYRVCHLERQIAIVSSIVQSQSFK